MSTMGKPGSPSRRERSQALERFVSNRKMSAVGRSVPAEKFPSKSTRSRCKEHLLLQTAQLAITYATDANGLVVDVQNGQVKDLNLDASNLEVFWLGPENLPQSDQSWRVLSLPSVDKTLHTITSATPHLSTFALFVPGAATSGAASTRPATRIIIPNGNPANPDYHFRFGCG